MLLAQELSGGSLKWLHTGRINIALRNHNVAEIARYIRSSENIERFFLDCPPVNEDLGRHISDAILQNSHTRELWFKDICAIRNLVAWIASRNTLVNMTSLEHVRVYARDDMSASDCTALFPLLLTSMSLHKFDICFRRDNGCSDDVMSSLLTYVGTASLRAFDFQTRRLSEAAFAALCNGVALSTVRQITLGVNNFQNFDLETAAESLAQMIVESSLEDVTISGGGYIWLETFISALKLTAPVRNMDFAFIQIGYHTYTTRLRINRKWKPLVIDANTPLALWPHILEKSDASPETSHSSVDIVFYVLKEKPDLVPAP